MFDSMHVYEVRPRKDRRGFDLISEALPFGRLVWRAKRNQQREVLAADHIMLGFAFTMTLIT